MGSKCRKELRKSTVMGQMVQSLRSPLMDGREQLMMRSESPAMAGGHPLTQHPVGLNPSPFPPNCGTIDPTLNLSEAQVLHGLVETGVLA